LRNDLACAYMNRGIAKQLATGYGPAAAIADYDAAVKLQEALRLLLEPEGRWEAGLRNGLAKAYMNRGNAKQSATGHGPKSAIADHDAAIQLMEELRLLLEPEGRWEAQLRMDLANAYMFRGSAKRAEVGSQRAAALASYDAAVAVLEGLRDTVSAQAGDAGWLPAHRMVLAQAYIARCRVGPRAEAPAHLDAVLAIANGLEAGGFEQTAGGVRRAVAVAKLPRPVLWVLERLMAPFAAWFRRKFNEVITNAPQRRR
jgi:hypothetical protein